MAIEISARKREAQGTGASRRLRRLGKVPGIVYGGDGKPQTIEVDHNALIYALKREAFHSTILTMTLGETTQRVLLRDVQMHPFRHEVLHIDFQRVDENRKIHMKVPLHFVNADISPAVKVSGAIVSHVINELAIICLPKDLPGFIEVDLSELDTKAAHRDLIAVALDVTRLEAELWVPLGVEEIRRLQVGGQVLVLHVHARYLRRAGDDRGLSAGIEPRSDLAELPAEGTGEVVDLEADRGMDRVERPGPHRHRLPGVCRNAHLHSSLSPLYLSTQPI